MNTLRLVHDQDALDRLRADHLAALREIAAAHPEMTFWQVHDLAWERIYRTPDLAVAA